MYNKKIHGIIGITDEGQLIVTAEYKCQFFTEQATRLVGTKECWYCKFADFRKSYDITLQQSICRCPKNRVNVVEGGKNEHLQISTLAEDFVSNIRGGIITCIFNSKTQSSKAVYINDGWTAITGYTLDNLNSEKGGNPQALVFPDDKISSDLEYNRQMKLGNEYALIYRVIRRNGTTIWVIDRGFVNKLPNGDVQNQSIITEVTELKEQEERLQRLAQLDQLSGLYNKSTFTQQAKLVLERQCSKLHAIMILDIDNFKKVNDSIGHAYGDKLIQLVADCLKSLFRNRDVLGRVGGDEFMIIMTDIPDIECVAQKSQDICDAISRIKVDEATDIAITASLGIVISTDGADYDDMFRQADLALYRAKNNGKNQFAFYNGSEKSF